MAHRIFRSFIRKWIWIVIGFHKIRVTYCLSLTKRPSKNFISWLIMNPRFDLIQSNLIHFPQTVLKTFCWKWLKQWSQPNPNSIFFLKFITFTKRYSLESINHFKTQQWFVKKWLVLYIFIYVRLRQWKNE